MAAILSWLDYTILLKNIFSKSGIQMVKLHLKTKHQDLGRSGWTRPFNIKINQIYFTSPQVQGHIWESFGKPDISSSRLGLALPLRPGNVQKVFQSRIPNFQVPHLSHQWVQVRAPKRERQKLKMIPLPPRSRVSLIFIRQSPPVVIFVYYLLFSLHWSMFRWMFVQNTYSIRSRA